jgi:hypothetical protein
MDGASWAPCSVYPISYSPTGAVTVAATTQNYAYTFNCAGVSYFQVRFAPYTSGNVLINFNLDSSPQGSPISQYTLDNGLNKSISDIRLYTAGPNEAIESFINPSANPSRPNYLEPKFANAPRIFRRLRVEAGGDQCVPFAQEPQTNRMMVSTPELYLKLEELVYQQALTNQLLAQAFTLTLPIGTKEIE